MTSERRSPMGVILKANFFFFFFIRRFKIKSSVSFLLRGHLSVVQKYIVISCIKNRSNKHRRFMRCQIPRHQTSRSYARSLCELFFRHAVTYVAPRVFFRRPCHKLQISLRQNNARFCAECFHCPKPFWRNRLLRLYYYTQQQQYRTDARGFAEKKKMS